MSAEGWDDTQQYQKCKSGLFHSCLGCVKVSGNGEQAQVSPPFILDGGGNKKTIYGSSVGKLGSSRTTSCKM